MVFTGAKVYLGGTDEERSDDASFCPVEGNWKRKEVLRKRLEVS